MRQTKLLLLLLLALVMSATGTFAQTVGTSFTINGITYRITVKDLTTPANNTVEITSIKGNGSVTVPASVTNSQDLFNYKVTATAAGGMIAQSGVTEVVLPEGLTTIGNGGFASCPTLQKITIPASCTTIGSGCFTACDNFTTFTVADGNSNYQSNSDGVLLDKAGTTLVYYPSGKAVDYAIPNGITTVSPTAFTGCRSLGRLTIPASVTTMDFNGTSPSISGSGTYIDVDDANMVYSDNDGVLCNKAQTSLLAYPYNRTPTSYTVPSTVTSIAPMAFYSSTITSVDLANTKTIGNNAFQLCQSLTDVVIGKGVEDLGEGTFIGCFAITAFNVAEDNTHYMSKDGVIFTEDEKTLVLYPAGKQGDYAIPEGTVSIASQAFYNAQGIGNLTIPTTLTTINDRACSHATITGLTFSAPSSLQKIGASAFFNTRMITTTIPASVSNIGVSAFASCANLETVYVEDGSQISVMPGTAFASNPKLTTFKFLGSSALTKFNGTTFSNDPVLESFEIPSGVTEIGRNTFQNTPKLTSVTFKAPASITTIGANAFASSGITSISLPETVTTIKQQAFDNCTNLTTIDIPASVTSIETGTFNMCENLTAINVDASNTKYSSLDGMLCDKSKTELVVFPAGKADTRYTLIPNFSTVKAYAFYGSQKVTNITFPATVSTIENYSIALCNNLKSLSFMGEDNVPVLNANIMYKSGNANQVTVYVRKKWYESHAADVTTYNGVFKEVHPSFVSTSGYDRGTEFFPTSTTNVGVISFYTPRTSVIINPKATETTYTDVYGKTWPTKTYDVSSILDYAYQNETTVKGIVVLADVGIIGLDAFKAGNQLKGIYFVGNTPALLNSVDYELPNDYPFNDGQTIYVKESKVSAYQDTWTQGHTLNITYKIPATTLAYRATACYPFDVVYNTSGDVMPYLPLQYKRMTQMSQDKAYVRAKSIDNGYVPAFFGVMLASENSASASSYCQMDENQSHTAISDADYNAATYYMVGVVEDTPIANTTSNTLFGLSKSGTFKKISDSGNTIPYFKAYLSIPNADIPMGAKSIQFVFGDFDSETTGIDGITEKSKDSDDAPYYNLNGVQVNKPSKGVYIHNGKKIIIK